MEKAVVSIALATLRDLLLEEGKFLYGVSSEVKTLEKQLKEMKCLLEDADKRQHESKSVINWIAEIRDLAHRAQDAIETYAVEVCSRRSVRGLKQLLCRFSCILNEGYTLHQIGSEISEIKSELARVTRNMQDYGLRSIIQGESSTAHNIPGDNKKWRRQTFPHEIEDCFVGMVEELKRLVSLIVDDKQHRIISIWGMGDIGKTTIARKVYNHDSTKRCFESFAWVCITQQCQIRSILEDVLKQLNPQIGDISSLSNTWLIGQLCEIQKAKRCMVVLDDLWEIDHWDGLKLAFLLQGSKCKIMVTTRKQKVAEEVGLAFELGLLSVDDGLELLEKKAFLHSNIPGLVFEERWLQQIGKEMVRKCGSLPLVISLLGGVLSRKKSMREWESVNENINAYLYRRDDIEKENEIHGVLSLSFEDLPYYLKPCFLYMGLFKEDEIIHATSVYKLWIAQGMISHENQGEGETLVEVAELYLSELVSRSIVQVEVDDAISRQKYGLCKLHDVVRELCLSKGKKDFGLQILTYQGGKFSTLLHQSLSSVKTQHLAIHFEREMEVESDEFTIIHEDTSKHVRSLQFINYTNGKRIEFPRAMVDFQTFKLLRVLVFMGIKFEKRKLPRGICNLIHLRYLHLQGCELDELPSSISNLVYLHTLDLQFSWSVRVPNVLKNMYRLKHLILPFYREEEIGNYQLRLDEGLDELETLLWLDSSVHDLKSITRMKNLRSLSATVCDNESLSAIINAITTNWKSLQYCAIIISHGCQFTLAEEGLMNLKKVFACSNLTSLGISVQLGKLLKECENQIITSTLVSLALVECEIEDDPMEILGKLPCLEQLCLSLRSFVGEEMKCHACGFPRLKQLTIAYLPNLREWKVDEGAMPILSEIKINYCPHLEMVPDGLRFINTLQKLTVTNMQELGERVSQDRGEDFEKVQHIPSIIIY